ncbi:MAG: pilus assembly protein PilM [Clostridia bacterium]|nr:pilus assembly protein PilM [Clostridia bacterium]
MIFKRNRIGIELGTAFIKIVKVSYNKSKIKLLEYMISPLPSTCFNDGRIENMTVFSSLLKKYIEQISPAKSDIYITLDSKDIITRQIDMPYMSEAELKKAIKYQADQYLPIDVDDYVIDYKILGIQQQQGNEIIKTLVGAVPIEIIEGLSNASAKAKIKIKGIDLYCNSIYKFFKNILKDDIDTGVIIIDIGAKHTHFTAFNNNFFASQTIQLGAETLIDVLSENLNLDKEQAEKNMISKLDLSIDNIINNTHMVKSVKPVLQILNQEIFKMNEYYKSRNFGKDIGSAILIGGGGNIDGMDEYIQFNSGLNVQTLNQYLAKNNILLFDSTSEDASFLCGAVGATVRQVDSG